MIDPLLSQRPQEYRNAIHVALQRLRERDTSNCVRARYLGQLDSLWKTLPGVEDRKIVSHVLRAGAFSVLYRLPGRGIPGTDWPREGLSLDDARARLDLVLAHSKKSDHDSRTRNLAQLIRSRLASVEMARAVECGATN